ncbi:MAG: integrase arm-type DNA-binding domain-containing protein [Campylobacteraceae bacterium]|jgi:integrase|nr:integrase arm-type DNA-binding domain-containing protein [Campylobacteraceae bacterium]
MPKLVTPLSELKVKNAKPKDKIYKLFDGNGLCLVINVTGVKYWHFRYKIDGKEQLLSIGKYPEISLAQAREKHKEYYKQVKNGINPTDKRKKKLQNEINSLEKVAQIWLEKNADRISLTHKESIEGYLRNHINPQIGNLETSKITVKDVIKMAEIIEAKGYLETLRKVLNTLNSIFKFAVSKEYAPHNIIADIDRKNTFKQAVKRNFPVIIEPKKLGQLLRDIDNYHGNLITKYALQLAPHVFLRPANLRFAEWSEIDLDKKIWRIPKEKMKTKTPHIIPLSKQVIEIIQNVKKIIGNGKYLFPSPTSNLRPICENTLVQALRRLDYTKDEIVAHSFRGIASTILHENISAHGIHSDAIERQLAHSERNGVKAAYNHAEYMLERVKLMQWWSDYLDNLKNS